MTAPLPDSPPVSRARRRWVIAAVAVAVLAAILAWIFWPPPEIVISRETTYITSPLRPDGRPDYVRYLNEKFSEGVTPENNAAVLLFQAVDPEATPAAVRSPFYRALGITEPVPGAYIESLPKFLARTGTPAARETVLMGAINQSPELLDGATYPELAAWVESNSEGLSRLEEASRRTRFHIPILSANETPSLVGARFPDFLMIQAATHALRTRAFLRLSAGDVDGAAADSVALHRLGRLFDQSPWLMCRLIGASLQAGPPSPAKALLLSGKMTRNQIRDFRAELNQLPPLQTLDRMAETEWLFLFSMITDSWQSDVITGVRYPQCTDPNHLLRVLNTHRKRDSANTLIANPVERMAALHAHAAEIRRLDAELRRPRWRRSLTDLWNEFVPGARDVTRIDQQYVIEQLSLSFSNVEAQDRLRTELDLLNLGAAVIEYQQRTGELPASLSQLVPVELGSIPIDPWTGEPYHFQVENGKFAVSSARKVPVMDDQSRRVSRLIPKSPTFGTLEVQK